MGYIAQTKTTIEISDHIMQRAKRLIRQQNCTLRSLAEEGLSRILDEREGQARRAIEPVVFKGKGLSPEFQPDDWTKIREAAYEGRRA